MLTECPFPSRTSGWTTKTEYYIHFSIEEISAERYRTVAKIKHNHVELDGRNRDESD